MYVHYVSQLAFVVPTLIKYTYEGNGKHLELKNYGDERFYEIKASLSLRDTKRKIKFLERARHPEFER